jgi:hypothetical protein
LALAGLVLFVLAANSQLWRPAATQNEPTAEEKAARREKDRLEHLAAEAKFCSENESTFSRVSAQVIYWTGGADVAVEPVWYSLPLDVKMALADYLARCKMPARAANFYDARTGRMLARIGPDGAVYRNYENR